VVEPDLDASVQEAADTAVPVRLPLSERAAVAVRGSVAELLERGEALVRAHRYADAVDAVAGVQLPVFSAPDVALRLLFCEGWSLLYLGRLGEAAVVLERARDLAEAPSFGDLERGEALFRLACCRVKQSKISNAVALLTTAIDLTERAGSSAIAVRSGAHEWRSRCYQLLRDWEPARADAERALELAESIGDARAGAAAAMQCSLVAERCEETLLARYYAERGRTLAVEAGDRQTEARLLNNLGGLSFLLGEPEAAVASLKASFALSLELGNDADAAQAVSSLAQVHLRCGAPQLAEEQARHAISILGNRFDYLDEIGNVRIVLGRALLEQGRRGEAMQEFAAAEWAFERLGSDSHLAAAWVAQGDAYRADGDAPSAADLYRRAAEALQDVHF
jgi:tetratricopeptide (TPR) repeat protein